ncbi:MAG: hypothetical protein ACFFAS_15620 [Promethearchaeota archaeon]
MRDKKKIIIIIIVVSGFISINSITNIAENHAEDLDNDIIPICSTILTNNISLSDCDYSFKGEPSDLAGYSVASAGDFNGDGYSDILIGAPGDNGQRGKSYLIFGSESGWENNMSITEANASFLGESIMDSAGYSVASAGDYNKDGYDDILIGAPLNDDGGTDAGKVYLILGSESIWGKDVPLTQANASFLGENDLDRAGHSVAGAGDVNNDTYDDILIGAINNDDGADDAGKTYLILGSESGWGKDIPLTEANASFLGESVDDSAGRAVASAGDFDRDDYDDILIGTGEKVYLIFGKVSGWENNVSLIGADASFMGDSVGSAGDFNGDGYDDILIGTPGADAQKGKAYLILGSESGWGKDVPLTDANASFIGEDNLDQGGYSVASAGDVNNDTYDDILIGAINNDDGADDAGKTYLILGSESGWGKNMSLTDADASFIGEYVDDNAGRSVASAGDFNGDGYDDFLIGTYKNNDGGTDSGKVYLITPDLNNAPIVSNPLPENNTQNVDINPLLQVNVSDIDGQDITVYFYNNSSEMGVLIGTALISGGNPGIASINWSALEYNTTYKWNVKASDGIVNTTSGTWSFTTMLDTSQPPANSISGIPLHTIIVILCPTMIGTIYFFKKKSKNPK